MLNIIKTRYTLYLRAGRFNIVANMLFHMGLVIFIVYSKLCVIEFILLMPAIVFMANAADMTHYSIDMQNILPVFGIKKTITHSINTSIFKAELIPSFITTAIVSMLIPSCAPILIGYLFILLLVMPISTTILKRKKLQFIITLPLFFSMNMAVIFYINQKEILEQADTLMRQHNMELNIAVICFALFFYLLSAFLVRHIILQRPFCSPEVVAHNTKKKKL